MPDPETTTRQKLSLVLLGLLAGIVLLEIGLRLAGGIFLYYQERANIASLEEKGDFVILCLGESTTFNNYPRPLEEILNERIDDLKISVIDKGVPGIHTTHILARLEAYLESYRPDLVIAMMGVNDNQNTEVFVRPELNGRTASEIPCRREGIGKALANLRVYKLIRLLGQQAKHTFTIIDHRSGFIREHESPSAGLDSIPDCLESDVPTNHVTGLNRDSGYYVRRGNELSERELTDEAAEAYNKAAGLETADTDLLHALAKRLRELEAYPEAEAVYEKILTINPEDYLAYVELGVLARDGGRPDDTRDLFRKARALQPDLTWELIRIGRSYRTRGNDRMMERYCRLAIAVDPENYAGYSELGRLYVWLNRREKARKVLTKAIELNPEDAEAYARLGIIYEREDQPDEAKQAYRKALDINPGVWDAAYYLIMIYQREGNLEEAETIYRRMTEVAPGNYRTWGALAAFYSSQGKEDLAREYYKRESELRFRTLTPAMVLNYRTLRDVLRERGIPLVAMQYPMRPLEELREIFDDNEGIMFVDNEEVFKDAVRRDGYQVYFRDHFAGDFGHCTTPGNRLLAENIADSLTSLNVFSHQSRER